MPHLEDTGPVVSQSSAIRRELRMRDEAVLAALFGIVWTVRLRSRNTVIDPEKRQGYWTRTFGRADSRHAPKFAYIWPISLFFVAFYFVVIDPRQTVNSESSQTPSATTSRVEHFAAPSQPTRSPILQVEQPEQQVSIDRVSDANNYVSETLERTIYVRSCLQSLQEGQDEAVMKIKSEDRTQMCEAMFKSEHP